MKTLAISGCNLAGALLLGCSGVVPQASPPSHNVAVPEADVTALRLTIEPEQSGAPPRGERLRLTLENTSDEWLWLNYDLGLGPKRSSSTLWAEVSSVETGSEARWSCARKSLPDGPPRYIEFPPSARLSIVLLLSCYEFPAQGHVKIALHFRELQGNPPTRGDSSAIWYRGNATSNVLEIPVDPTPAIAP